MMPDSLLIGENRPPVETGLNLSPRDTPIVSITLGNRSYNGSLNIRIMYFLVVHK